MRSPFRSFRSPSIRTFPAKLRCVELEPRWVPTVNLILDFNGGTVPTTISGGFQYDFPTGTDQVTWKAFPGFGGNRTEQILQIVSGVREDYADFDVNVVWDDLGVGSPYFTKGSTVIMV